MSARNLVELSQWFNAISNDIYLQNNQGYSVERWIPENDTIALACSVL